MTLHTRYWKRQAILFVIALIVLGAVVVFGWLGRGMGW
jgi:hypothetical protein